MLCVEAIEFDQTDSLAQSRWIASYFDQPVTERADYWFETLNHPRFGQTMVLLCRGERARSLLSREGQSPAPIALTRVDWDEITRRLKAFAEDFGLSPAVARVLLTLIECGDVRKAANRAGVSYDTAREYLDKARTALGAENLPRLITFATLGASIEYDGSEETDALLVHAFGLTKRQVEIAGLTANGLTRREAAQKAGVSEALAKKELSTIFTAVGVGTAIELARVLVEMRLYALRLRLVSATVSLGEVSHGEVLVSTDAGRAIAVSDYGPKDGRPVIIMHSSMTCRPVNGALVRALQVRGFRPLSIDRPGFGGTSDAPRGYWAQRYFELAARDVLAVSGHFGWTSVPIVTRGAAQALLALHHLAPELIAAAVVMNPDPDARSSLRRDTFLAKMKRHFARRPGAVRVMAGWLARSATFERVRDHIHRAVAGCEADQRAMSIDDNMRDYYRAVRPFRDGRIDGFVREQVALATMNKPNPTFGASHFRLLVGEHDTIHEPAETLSYWKGVMPSANVQILAGAGRFMSYSHAEVVVCHLSDMLVTAAEV